MDREFKHDLGYGMSVFGFALVIFGGMLYPFVTLDEGWTLVFASSGLLFFLVGAELALRNQKHLHLDNKD